MTVIDQLEAKKTTARFATFCAVLMNSVMMYPIISSILNLPPFNTGGLVPAVMFELVLLSFSAFAIHNTWTAYLREKKSQDGIKRFPAESNIIEYVLEPPDECDDCGASLSAENVDWVGPRSVKCPYCGNTIEVVRKKALRE